MISVITPTVRPEGLDIVNKALKRQTLPREFFEWVLCVPEHIQDKMEYPGEVDKIVTEPELKEGDVWGLNKGYNAAVRACDGELIISWQDFTYAKPDTLERFWKHFEQEPKVLVGAVGNKYSNEDFSAMTWKDPRERDDQGSYYPCFFSDIEWNLCACPKQAIYDVGGWDEELDKFFGMDCYSVNERINMLGKYDFKLDQTIKSYSLEHGRPKNWEEKNAIHGPYQERKKIYVDNPVLPFLQ